jgi:hypothetical protein
LTILLEKERNFIGKRKKFYWKKKEILLEKERQDYRHK